MQHRINQLTFQRLKSRTAMPPFDYNERTDPKDLVFDKPYLNRNYE